MKPKDVAVFSFVALVVAIMDIVMLGMLTPYLVSSKDSVLVSAGIAGAVILIWAHAMAAYIYFDGRKK